MAEAAAAKGLKPQTELHVDGYLAVGRGERNREWVEVAADDTCTRICNRIWVEVADPARKGPNVTSNGAFNRNSLRQKAGADFRPYRGSRRNIRYKGVIQREGPARKPPG